MSPTYVPKACAYITRESTGELLVFKGPEYEHWQIPKGTVEPGESPIDALQREVFEETGLVDIDVFGRLRTDIWERRSGQKLYMRYFFHARTTEPRDEWVHSVTGDTDEHGQEFRCRWVANPADRQFALDLDDYLEAITTMEPVRVGGRRSEPP